MQVFIFYLFSALAIAAAALVVLQRRAVYSALALIVCLGSVAVLFFQLGAQFIGAVQVIVYAGAIMVLFLFVVMLLDPESEIFPKSRLFLLLPLGGLSAALLLYVAWRSVGGFSGAGTADGGSAMENTTLVAKRLFSDYLLPFEVTSVLILIAVIGAVVLTKRPQ